MSKKWKIMAGFVVIMLALSMSLAAQTSPPIDIEEPEIPSPESNTSMATQGRFVTGVDDFIATNSWNSVLESSSRFAFIGYGDYLQLGYAQNLGPIYLGAFYTGNIVRATNLGKKENVSISYGNTFATYGQATGKTKIITHLSDSIETENDIDVLVGIGGIGQGLGIRLGFYEKMETRKNPAGNLVTRITEDYNSNITTYTNELESYSYQNGWLVPNINAGINLALGGLTVKPYLKAGLGFYRENEEQKVKSHTEVNGKTTGSVDATLTGFKNDFLRPSFKIGADVDVTEHFGAGVAYEIRFDVYNNKYDVFDNSEDIHGTVSYGNSTGGSTSGGSTVAPTTSSSKTDGVGSYTYIDTSAITLQEVSAIGNAITPGVWYSNALGDLSFGLYLEVPVKFGNDSIKTWEETRYIEQTGSDPNDKYTTTITTFTAKTYGNTVETTRASIAPVFQAGASYPLIKERLILNGGVKLTLPKYTYTTVVTKPGNFSTTTEVTTDGNGKIVSPEINTVDTTVNKVDRVEVSKEWALWQGGVSAGFAFYFTPNFAVDVAMSATAPTNSFRFFVNQWNILFTIKK